MQILQAYALHPFNSCSPLGVCLNLVTPHSYMDIKVDILFYCDSSNIIIKYFVKIPACYEENRNWSHIEKPEVKGFYCNCQLEVLVRETIVGLCALYSK